MGILKRIAQVEWKFFHLPVDVIKLDFNQFVSCVRQNFFNYFSEGRVGVVTV